MSWKNIRKQTIYCLFCSVFHVPCGICTQETANTAEIEQDLEEGVYINGKAIELTESGSIDLPVLSVENGITVQVVAAEDETVYVNGEEASGYVDMDISSITREDVINLEIEKDGETRGCKIFCVYGNETFQIRIRYVVVFVGFCSRVFCRIYLSGYSISCPLSFMHAF